MSRAGVPGFTTLNTCIVIDAARERLSLTDPLPVTVTSTSAGGLNSCQYSGEPSNAAITCSSRFPEASAFSKNAALLSGARRRYFRYQPSTRSVRYSVVDRSALAISASVWPPASRLSELWSSEFEGDRLSRHP